MCASAAMRVLTCPPVVRSRRMSGKRAAIAASWAGGECFLRAASPVRGRRTLRSHTLVKQFAVCQQAYSSVRRLAFQASKLSRARSVSNGAKVCGFALYRQCRISVNEFIVPLSGLASNSAL